MNNPPKTTNKVNKTILKWAGSKVRIMEQLRPHLPKARRLVEPFAGSCAVMMNADYEQYFIADINDDLINLYQSIDNHSIEMILHPSLAKELELRWSKLNTSKSYYAARKMLNKRKVDDEERAMLFLLLNRHGYNGLCRYNQSGEFNVPYGHYKTAYFPKDEIIAFAQKTPSATFTCLPWQDTLSLVEESDGIYCDPPYMGSRDSFTQYHTQPFTDADHEALAFALKGLNDMQGNPITVSNSPEAKTLYADLGFTVYDIDAPRSIRPTAKSRTAPEIIAVLKGVK